MIVDIAVDPLMKAENQIGNVAVAVVDAAVLMPECN
jgi:hypothetical protein